jgi:hypothetical protein
MDRFGLGKINKTYSKYVSLNLGNLNGPRNPSYGFSLCKGGLEIFHHYFSSKIARKLEIKIWEKNCPKREIRVSWIEFH